MRAVDGAPVYIALLSGGFMGLCWMTGYAWLFRVLVQASAPPLSAGSRLLLDLAAPLGGSILFAWIALGLDRQFLVFLLVPSFHAGATFLLPVCAGLAVKIMYRASVVAAPEPAWRPWLKARAFERIGRRRFRSLLAFACLVALALASDRIFVLTALIPVLLTLPTLGFRNLSGVGWYVATLALALAAADYLARWMNRGLVLTSLTMDWSRLFTTGFLDSLLETEELAKLATSTTLLPFYFSLIVFACTAIIAKRDSSFPCRALVLWLLRAHVLTILLLFVGMAVVGYASTGTALILRYTAPAIAMFLMPAAFSSLLLYAKWNHARGQSPGPVKRIGVYRTVGLAGSAASLALAYATFSRPFYRAPLKDPATYAYPAMGCIRDHQARIGRFGFGDYWAAKKFMFLTGGDLHVNQLRPELDLMHWVNNFEWYYAAHRAEAGYSFVIENGLKKDRIRELYGAPSDEIRCGEYRFLIYDHAPEQSVRWVYPPEVLDFALEVLGRTR
ncbi:MAG: hypothetical protein RIF32_11500 [Leptospirales bacterium]